MFDVKLLLGILPTQSTISESFLFNKKLAHKQLFCNKRPKESKEKE